MNDQELLYFSKLRKDREESARVFSKPSNKGVWKSIVEKYSDQAHFVYELLQNADDVKATYARFLLKTNCLIYAHNGTRGFSISNPDNEENDSISGALGDINAITSIGNSNKTEASIGKFGVGFKAVFQYTNTPYIYDDSFRFKIDNRIVPKLIEHDNPERKNGETLFVLPFDNEKRQEIAYMEISNRLKHLLYPQLFLSHLESISFQMDDVCGCYKKTIGESFVFQDITAENISLTMDLNGERKEEKLWLFSITNEEEYKCSVGFFVDTDGNLRPANNIPAFCFFATKVNTGLNFIIHAPFLLTDSREGIQAGDEHNVDMINTLAELAADSIVLLKRIGEQKNQRLIDDNIVDIIPYNQYLFSDSDDTGQISFAPFFEMIRRVFKEEEIIPAQGGYARMRNAYWASVQNLATLFSNEQLGMICDNEDAKWVFTTKGRDSIVDNNNILSQYIDSIVETNLDDESIIKGRGHSIVSIYNRYTGGYQIVKKVKGITPEFIERQPISWLHKFYNWLYESRVRTNMVKTRRFFLDQGGKAVAAYDEDGHLILFLPLENMSGYEFVSSELLADNNTRHFIESIGIKEPSQKDYIYNVILPRYRGQIAENVNPVDDFRTIFDFYCNCKKEEARSFVACIKDLRLLQCTHSGELSRNTGEKMYMPFVALKSFFAAKTDTLFIKLKEYQSVAGETRKEELLSFLNELGVRMHVPILEYKQDIDPLGKKQSFDDLYRQDNHVPRPNSRQKITYTERYIDGCRENVNFIVANQSKSKSILLWDSLIDVINRECEENTPLSNRLKGFCEWHYHKKLYCMEYVSLDELSLKNNTWLVDSHGVFRKPEDLTTTELAEEYRQTSDAAQKLIAFLGLSSAFSEDDVSADPDSNLTESQRGDIALGRFARENGMNREDLEEFLKYKRIKERKQQTSGEVCPTYSSPEHKPSEERWHETAIEPESFEKQGETPAGINDDTAELEKEFDVVENDEPDNVSEKTNHPRVSRRRFSVVKDIIKQMQKTEKEKNDPDENADEEIDQDEYIPRAINYQQRIKSEKQKSASAIRQIEYMEELQKRAGEVSKYSFAWFKTLLEMEYLNSSETNSGSREISIEFSKVEREPGTHRILVLKQPNRYIPQFMEDLADIPLVLHMDNMEKTVVIEVSNIKSYTLRVKLKNPDDINDIDLSLARSATIDAKSPVFLLEELRRQFLQLDLSDEYDMQKNLCDNIEFIFGPPGTGKTTYLARKVLAPMMTETDDKKVLVLTPTNKAADVLTRRIKEMEEFSADRSYEKWLVRFGSTGDETIEKSAVFKDKTFDIRTFHRNVTVTTIARFPYDFFMPDGVRLHLRELKWDCIVIDEASMIPLVNIIYPLYKKTPRKFVIAGDPFQIQPITSVDLWKDENIYSLVHLDSFQNPNTVPHPYQIENLFTQYRSIPEIGAIFSKFAYDGILKHNRTSESRIPLNLGNELDVKALNILKFPVSKYESIYRAKRLQHRSAYQIYSAVFTFEYICYLSLLIAEKNPGKVFKIGVIAPYRAQADLIEKLVSSKSLPKEVDVQVGTIHGFQGDECDIIFSVFNTPPTITRSREMFLNNRNIINVSISRARDYLFVVMPDDKTENISNLYCVKHVERLVKQSNSWIEKFTPDIEQMMFGDPCFLENNAFSTSHQNVNVYGLPEKTYEVRTEENAVDIQIHIEK